MTTMALDRPQPDARDAVITWITAILQKKQWNGTELARKSNLAPSTILRLMNDEDHPFIPSLKTLKKVSDGSGEPIPQVVMQAIGPQIGRFEDESPANNAVSSVPGRSPVPIMPASRAAEMIRQTKVKVRHVSSLPYGISTAQAKSEVLIDSPKVLEGDATAFAFYNPDRMLEPWVKAGTQMFATKRRDPRPGDLVLVTDKEGRSKVRLLEDMNEEGLVLSRCQPPGAEETLSFADVEDIATVAVVDLLT